MKGKKNYAYPKRYLLDTIHDIVELQNGKLLISDAIYGRVFYRLSMYGYTWELLYNIVSLNKTKCCVTIEISGERRDKKKEIRREFALLDVMLGGDTQVEIVEEAEHNRPDQPPLRSG
jgi:hypothetical protein